MTQTVIVARGACLAIFTFLFAINVYLEQFWLVGFFAVMACGYAWLFLEAVRNSKHPFWVGFYDAVSFGPLRRFVATLMGRMK